MNPEEQIQEEAKRFAEEIDFITPINRNLARNVFRRGAAFGRRLERERVLEILRSVAATHFYLNKKDGDLSCYEVSDWLEKQLEQE